MKKAILLMSITLILLNFQTSLALKEQEKENVRKQISSVRAWKLTEDLKLSEEQAQILFPAQKAYQDRKEELHKQREATEKELDGLLAAEDKDDQLIKEKMAQLKNIDAQSRSNEDQFRSKISQILTVEQQAKYELFDKKFDTHLREMIKDIKKERSEVKTQTEKKTQEAPRASKKVTQEKIRTDESQERQTRTQDSSEAKRPEKKSEPEEKKSPQRSSSSTQEDSKEKSSRQSESSEERSSRPSGSSKSKSPRGQR